MQRRVDMNVYRPIKRKAVIGDLTWVVLGTYCAFILFIPFEMLDLGGITIPSFFGYLFVVTTLLKPRLCYRRLDKALSLFAIYLAIFVLLGLSTILGLPKHDLYLSDLRTGFQTLVQLLVFFWISSNLLLNGRIVRMVLFTLATGCLVLAVCQAAGFTGEVVSSEDRVAAFGTNPNSVGFLLTPGLIALIGLAYGQEKINARGRAFFWLFSAVLLLAIIRTGSRGAIVGLLAGCTVFLVQRASLWRRLKLWMVITLSVAFVVIASYNIEGVRVRWERSFTEGETTGRDVIYAQAQQMFLEKPFLGWGPIYHQVELGRRVRYFGPRDFHNLYLHVLTEGGVLAAAPFFLGLLFCCRSAWRARKTSQGILPMAILVSMLVGLNMSGTGINERMFWLGLAYAAASGTYPLSLQKKRESIVVLKFRRGQPVTSPLVQSNSSRYRRIKQFAEMYPRR